MRDEITVRDPKTGEVVPARRAGAPASSPAAGGQIAHPSTGEVITLDQVASKVVGLANAIEESNAALTVLVYELAGVNALYADVYDEALIKSEQKSKEKREAEARRACRLYKVPGPVEGVQVSLAERQAELQRDVTVARDTQHNLRSVMSGWQTAAGSVKAAMQGWGYSA